MPSVAYASGVRRERCCCSRGCETHPALIVRPEAVEVVVEVTKGQEPSMSKGCFRRLSERAGRNVSERRAGLENALRRSRPSITKGEGRSHRRQGE